MDDFGVPPLKARQWLSERLDLERRLDEAKRPPRAGKGGEIIGKSKDSGAVEGQDNLQQTRVEVLGHLYVEEDSICRCWAKKLVRVQRFQSFKTSWGPLEEC